MSELLPCPFCGGEAETLTAESMHGGYLFGIMCNDCRSRGDVYDTEAEAIAAWNSRAPIEYDGWFYLPKPKEGIVQYGAPYAEEVENGYKIKQTVEVIESAIRSWGDELGDYVMKRICEVWNSRAERTCEWELEHSGTLYDKWRCSKCGYLFVEPRCDQGYTDLEPNYCPNCGARVKDVDE